MLNVPLLLRRLARGFQLDAERLRNRDLISKKVASDGESGDCVAAALGNSRQSVVKDDIRAGKCADLDLINFVDQVGWNPDKLRKKGREAVISGGLLANSRKVNAVGSDGGE